MKPSEFIFESGWRRPISARDQIRIDAYKAKKRNQTGPNIPDRITTNPKKVKRTADHLIQKMQDQEKPKLDESDVIPGPWPGSVATAKNEELATIARKEGKLLALYRPYSEGYTKYIKSMVAKNKHSQIYVEDFIAGWTEGRKVKIKSEEEYYKIKLKLLPDGSIAEFEDVDPITEVHRFDRHGTNLNPEPISDYFVDSKKLFKFTSHTGERITVYRSGAFGDEFAAADSNDMLQMSVSGEWDNHYYDETANKKSTFWIDKLESISNNRKVWASEFYAQLILKLNMVLVSGQDLSDSGAAVWSRLTKDPRLQTYIFDAHNKKIWNVPTNKRAEFIAGVNNRNLRYVATKRSK